MNTRFNYLYRDANNYKTFAHPILEGILTKKQKARLIACLNEGLYFIPSQVGLADIQSQLLMHPGDKLGETDRVWYELNPEDLEETFEGVTAIWPRAEELLANFLAAKGSWDVSKTTLRLGIPDYP